MFFASFIAGSIFSLNSFLVAKPLPGVNCNTTQLNHRDCVLPCKGSFLQFEFSSDVLQGLPDSDEDGRDAEPAPALTDLHEDPRFRRITTLPPLPKEIKSGDLDSPPALTKLPPLPIHMDEHILDSQLPPIPPDDEDDESARRGHASDLPSLPEDKGDDQSACQNLPPLPEDDGDIGTVCRQHAAGLPPLPQDDWSDEWDCRNPPGNLPPLPVEEESDELACRQRAAGLPPLPEDEWNDESDCRNLDGCLPPLPVDDESDEMACRHFTTNLPPLPEDCSDSYERPAKRRRREVAESSSMSSRISSGLPRGLLPGPTRPHHYRRLGDRRESHSRIFEVRFPLLSWQRLTSGVANPSRVASGSRRHSTPRHDGGSIRSRCSFCACRCQ